MSAPATFLVPQNEPARVSIRAPLEKGWQVTQRMEHAVSFSNRDAHSGSDLIAVAAQFEPQSRNTEADFMDEVKRNEASSGRGTLRIVSSKYELSRRRGYLCVTVRTVADEAARSNGKLSLSEAPVRVHARTLVCRKSETSRHGLFAFFQYPAPTPSPKFEAMADSFFNGVQFVN